MAKYYWHNITKDIYNQNDMLDFVEKNLEKGDLIKFTERGNAIIQDLETLKDDDFNEYKELKSEFLEMFKEFNGFDLYNAI